MSDDARIAAVTAMLENMISRNRPRLDWREIPRLMAGLKYSIINAPQLSFAGLLLGSGGRGPIT
jgi:hypothetical protein